MFRQVVWINEYTIMVLAKDESDTLKKTKLISLNLKTGIFIKMFVKKSKLGIFINLPITISNENASFQSFKVSNQKFFYFLIYIF